MALSGSYYKNVNSHWRLSIEWSATQNITNNTSTVTAKMYWQALDSYGAVNSSATKTSAIQHDDGSWSTESSSGMASLSGNQKKLINTYAFTVTHDSDGTKTFSLDGYFDAEITLSGTYYGRIDMDQVNFTLNTIPRETTLSGGASWTAGKPISLSFDKKNSGYTTNVTIKVNGVAIKTITGITGSSYSYTFTDAENEDIFQQLDNDTTYWNQASTIEVTTKSGSTTIGSMKSSGGTVSSPAVTQVSGSSFKVGASTTIVMSSEQNSNFVYDLTAKLGSYTKTLATKAGYANITWDTGDDASSLLGQLSSNSGTVTYTLTTYWKNGTSYTKVRTADTTTVTASVDTAAQSPGFAPSGANAITYYDSATGVTTVTGGGVGSAFPCIVQGKSTLVVNLPVGGLATPKTGTSITSYKCTFNGVTKTNTTNLTAAQTFTFTASELASASIGQNAVVSAVDGRGNSTAVSVSVNVIPYAVPKVTATAARDDGFTDPTTLKLSGSISPLNVNGVNKNSIKKMTYAYVLSGGTFPAGTAFTAATATFPNYAAVDKALATQLVNTSAWDVQFYVEDQLGSTTVVKTVGVGVPIMFMDSEKKSVGINMLPSGAGNLEISTGIGSSTKGIIVKGTQAAGTIWTGTGGIVLQSTGTSNLHLGQNNTSDMIFSPTEITVGKEMTINADVTFSNKNVRGFNSIWFSDEATSGGEGILFPKSGVDKSTNVADYYGFWIEDGVPYIDGVPIHPYPAANTLWSGAYYMNDTQSIPIKDIATCANGWILCWSDYDANTGTANDSDMFLCYIHKKYVANFNGKWMTFVIGNYTTSVVVKYLGVYNDKLTGHANNDVTTTSGSIGNPNDVVLRRVWEW
jgi:hypothetical protein